MRPTRARSSSLARSALRSRRAVATARSGVRAAKTCTSMRRKRGFGVPVTVSRQANCIPACSVLPARVPTSGQSGRAVLYSASRFCATQVPARRSRRLLERAVESRRHARDAADASRAGPGPDAKRCARRCGMGWACSCGDPAPDRAVLRLRPRRTPCCGCRRRQLPAFAGAKRVRVELRRLAVAVADRAALVYASVDNDDVIKLGVPSRQARVDDWRAGRRHRDHRAGQTRSDARRAGRVGRSVKTGERLILGLHRSSVRVAFSWVDVKNPAWSG